MDSSEAAMTGTPILDEVRVLAESCSSVRPRGRTKLTGALAIEVMRRHLHEAGIPVSARDVFLRGNPTEFDTLVVRASARPLCGIIYDPGDVAAILEIKYSGIYSQDVPTALRKSFQTVKAQHPHIQCVYLTVCENPRFRFRITTATLGFPAFTLYWVNPQRTIDEPGDALQSVVACLQNALRELPASPA
jgi:hypothetical protein